MKTIKIMIISLLLVATQAFAWGKGEQKALIEFTAGVVLTHLASNHDNNSDRSHSGQTVYVDRYQKHKRFNHYERRHPQHRDRFSRSNYDRRYDRDYSKHHQHPRNRVVVKNSYRTSYY